MDLRIELLHGSQIAPHVMRLGALRVAVFREYPYLYEGSLHYETNYLRGYAESPRAMMILAWDGETCVGASSVIPLVDAALEVQEPFLRAAADVTEVAYYGESVVLAEYRGLGLGRRFFAEREAHARAHGLRVCTFSAVERERDHPRCPEGYKPNDGFWERLGYRQHPTLRTTLSWIDVDQTVASRKNMVFWTRELGPAPASGSPTDTRA